MSAIACPYSAIVFDLDGTLIDSAPDIGRAVNALLAEQGLPAIDAAMTRRFVGEGGRVLVDRAFAHHGMRLDEARLDELTARFVDHYRRDPVAGTVLYPGSEKLLRAWHGQGVRLAICTNKFESLSVDILRRLAVLDLFACVAGADTFAMRKPDPGHLLETLKRIGVGAGDAAMVGDSVHDVETARRAHVPVVAVAWGYSATPAHQLGADAVIGAYSELPAVLRRLRDGARVS